MGGNKETQNMDIRGKMVLKGVVRVMFRLYKGGNKETRKNIDFREKIK